MRSCLRYNFARLDYQNLLVLVPGNFQAQLGLALLNEKDKHYTEAYDGINSLIEQYPDSAMAYAARGGMEKERVCLNWQSLITLRRWNWMPVRGFCFQSC